MENSITITCVLCGSKNIKMLFTSHNTHGRHLLDASETFDVFLCGECSAAFLGSITVSGDYYRRYYPEGYYENTSPSVAQKVIQGLSKFSVYRKQKMILRHFGARQRAISILDVGCGSGGFLLKLDDSRFVKYGVEINPEGAALSRKRGLHIYGESLLATDFQGAKFDVITLWHVLEHLPNPIEILQKVHSLLSYGGLLMFEVPNIDSVGFRYGREQWFHLDSPRHLILYNKKSIQRLCALTKFQVVGTFSETIDYPLDLFWSLRHSPLRFIAYPLYPIVKVLSRETIGIMCQKV